MHKRQFIKNVLLAGIGTPIGIAGFAKTFADKKRSLQLISQVTTHFGMKLEINIS
jgi:hypothetical protein